MFATTFILFAPVTIALGPPASTQRANTWADAAAAAPGVATDVAVPTAAVLPPNPIDGGTIPQLKGFPRVLPLGAYFAPTRGAAFADLVPGDDLELVVSNTDNKVYAFDSSGVTVPGFPVNTIGAAQYAPSIGDLDGDGDLEIVQTTRGLTSGGRLYAIDHTGDVLPGFPISLNNNNVEASPTLVDLDDDGDLEIITAERRYPLGYIWIFHHDGTPWEGEAFPVEMDHVPTCTAAVADIDNDGALEIFTMSYTTMYLIELDGSMTPGWPKQVAGARFSYQSPALVNLDADPELEIVVGAHWDAAGCYAFNHDGTSVPGWPRLAGTWTYCPPVVTDLDGDGALEVISGRAGGLSGPSACFWVWNANGAVRPGFPYVSTHGGGSEGALAVIDLDGDGVKEILADHNIMVDNQGYLFGVDANGNDLPGFPLRTGGFTHMNGAQVADMDGDGDYELAVLAHGDGQLEVSVFDLPWAYGAAAADAWPTYHANNRRTGVLDGGGSCDADLDGDGTVGVSDLLIVLGDWGCQDACTGDVDGDGTVGITDLLAVLASWGAC